MAEGISRLGRFIQEGARLTRLPPRESQFLKSYAREAIGQGLTRVCWIAGCLLLLAWAGCATQNKAPAPPVPLPPPSEQVVAAEAVVKRLHAAMMEIMQSGPALGYVGREALIMPVALEIYDFPAMAGLSYGAGWPKLSIEQQATWIEVYTKFHVSSTAKVRNVYRGQVYQLLGYKEIPDGHILIETQLNYPGRLVDFYTNYLMALVDGDWKIIDVFSPPSVSVVAMRRAEYRTVLEKSGYAGLISDMQEKMKRWSK